MYVVSVADDRDWLEGRKEEVYESGQVFFCPFASFERRTIVEVHAGCCSGNFGSLYRVWRWPSSSADGNGYFCRFYVASHQAYPDWKGKVGVHLSYLYNRRVDYHLKVSRRSYLRSIFCPDLTVICGIWCERLCVWCYLFAFQPFACAGRIAKNEVFYRRTYL